MFTTSQGIAMLIGIIGIAVLAVFTALAISVFIDSRREKK